jgi:hypothetical protein
MEKRYRILILSTTIGWMIAFTVAMIYFLIHVMLWFQSPPTSTILGYTVTYGLISGSIGGLSMGLGLKHLARLQWLSLLGLILGWAVSLALGLMVGWILSGQNSNNVFAAMFIGMTIGGGLGGLLTGYLARQTVWKIALGWAFALMVGQGVIYGLTELLNRGFMLGGVGILVVSSILGGAIAGAIGGRVMIQQMQQTV